MNAGWKGRLHGELCSFLRQPLPPILPVGREAGAVNASENLRRSKDHEWGRSWPRCVAVARLHCRSRTGADRRRHRRLADRVSRVAGASPGIDWARVEMFHLDEYVGLPVEHPASFRSYLLDRLIRTDRHRAPTTCSTASGCARTSPSTSGRISSRAAIDVAFVGIGENGHLAFNDPPADFRHDATVSRRRRSTRRAGGSRSARDGSRRLTTCRSAGDFDVGRADSEVARDPLRRARRAEGARGQGVSSKDDVSPMAPGVDSAAAHRTRRCISIAMSAALPDRRYARRRA